MKMKSFRFAAVAAVLLTFCLVFMAPASAEESSANNGVITVDTTEDLQAALDAATDGTTIKLRDGLSYGTVYLRPTAANVESVVCFPGHCGVKFSTVDDFKSHWNTENTGGGGHHPNYNATISNVKIVGAEGATIAGVQVFSGQTSAGTTDAVLGNDNTGTYYVALKISDLTFEGVAFTGRVNIESSHEDAVYDGVTFDGCSFTTGGTAETNGAAIRYYSEANNGKVKNIVVKDCTFNNCRQGVYVHHVNGVTVTDCTFDTTGHNAIAMQGHNTNQVNLKKVVITGNTFKKIGNRVIRFNDVGADSQITIQNNIMVDSGDSGGELIKATSVADGATINLENNYWDNEADLSKVIISMGVTPTSVGITDGTWKGDVSSYVADGYKAVANGDGTYTVSKLIVAKIESTGATYSSLKAAVDAAQSGDTIVLLDDVTLTETLTIPAGKTVTLDLSGKTISQTKECTASYNMIGNLGSLTIVDTVGKGKLSFTDSGKGDSSFGWGSYTIHNSGTLIIGDEGKKAVDFTIEHIGSQTSHCANAIFQYSGSTTIYGGNISTPNYRSVRLWMGELTIYDGTFTGNVWVHNAGQWDANSVNIYGGTFSPGTKGGYSVYSLLIDNTMNQITLNIYGGTFTSEIHVSDETKITASISGGTFTNDVSAYVKEDYICVQEAESEFVVLEKSETTVIPETPDVTVSEDDEGNLIITTDDSTTTIEQSRNENNEVVVTITPTTGDSSAVTITITGDGVEKDDSTNKVTVPESASITATYKEAEAETDEDTTSTEPQVTFQLSVDIKDITQALPVIDAKMIDEEKKEAVKENSGKEIKSFLASFTALGDNDENGVNGNLKNDDGKHAVTFVVKVHKSLVSNPHLMAALHIDGEGKLKTGSKPTLTWKEEGELYVVTITGPNFSSYVLVEEKPQDNLGGSGSGKDTGSGNYQYYPRDVPTSGIIDFGTSKVVKGMELPAGSSGKVTLNTKPTFAMPENGFYAFEIDAPGYNLDAKINGGLSFQIPLADLEAAGYTEKDIVLFHGTVAEDGKITWEALPTNLVKNENGIAYYKSAINGCSPFYIGFVKDGSVVNTEVVEPVTPPTDEPQDVPGEVLPEIPDVQDEPETPATPAPVLGVLAALGAAVVLRRK